ncbi:MAG: UvrD-helicase domain-containing protein [Candidatus Kaiserbacteria bacterium]|nr:UvrD-helicase domain-containing protein [Candidatus Kaiserbacteria bacterium]
MLNDEQAEAVQALNTSMLIVAGAGTGKTHVLIEKIAHLLKSGVPAQNILALTFTNKAADEMRDRIRSRCDTKPPFIGTFHAFCFSLLKEFPTEAGLSPTFVVLDRSACRTIVRQLMRDRAVREYTPSVMQNMIGKIKTGLIEPSESDPIHEYVQQLLPQYAEALHREKAVDFDDLILHTIRLLREQPAVREMVSSRYAYILVDEFQDTDRIQNTLVKMVKGDNAYIIAVGDTDQTIYSWRGASIHTMLSFAEQYRPVKTVFLTRNYRSTDTILSAANAVIAKNNFRQEKKLVSHRGGGDRITLLEVSGSEEDEAAQVAQAITGLHGSGVLYQDIAVLYRANFQSRALETGMLHAKVPYTVLGVRFFDRREVKDLLAYLTLTQNPSSQDALTRAAGAPRRGIGAKTLERLFHGEEDQLTSRSASLVARLRNDIERTSDHLQKNTVAETLHFLINEVLDYESYLKKTFDDYEDRQREVRELLVFADRFSHLSGTEGVAELLAEVALSGEQDSLRIQERNAVRLMTVHAAKGLEFPCVFVSGMEEGLFPFQRDDDGSGDPEEERRLFYVAMTRAKDHLYLSHTARRGIFGSYQNRVPSSFLADIPDPLLVKHSHATTAENDIVW